MPTIERLPSGRYRARIDVRDADGKRRRVSRTAATKRELRQLIADVELHGAPTSSALTLAELFRAYLDGPARTTMVDSSLVVVESKWRTMLEPRIGHLRLDQLTAARLDAAYGALLAAGYAPGSVRQAHKYLTGALRQAQRWGLVRHCVTVDATPPRDRRGDIDPPTPAEVRRLLECAAVDELVERHAWWPAWLRLAAATGARRGEVIAARWDDFAGREWRISRAVSSDTVSAEGKTPTSLRVIALDAGTLAELDRWRRFAGTSSGWCWPGQADGPVGRSTIDGLWSKTRAAAQLGRRVRLHDLRHAHATTLLSEGFDVRTVAGRLGHANPATLLRIYAAWMPARDEAAAGRIGELLAD